jgi:heme exporter protein A
LTLSAAAPAALTVRDLACVRNARTLFAGLSFTVETGACLTLTGPNGSGKTSLLRILAGLLPAQSGTVTVSGARDERDLAQHSVFVSSREPLKAALSVIETLRFWRDGVFAGEGGAHGQDRLQGALSRFELVNLANVPCAWLSSGQRRRLSLARLALSSVETRPLWLLDEPTNALDARARGLLAAAVTDHLAAGGLVVVATHDPLDWPAQRPLTLGAPLVTAGALSA